MRTSLSHDRAQLPVPDRFQMTIAAGFTLDNAASPSSKRSSYRLSQDPRDLAHPDRCDNYPTHVRTAIRANPLHTLTSFYLAF